MANIRQILLDAGINIWAADLLSESLLQNPEPAEIEFEILVKDTPKRFDRENTKGWRGVKIKLTPLKEDKESLRHGRILDINALLKNKKEED